MSAKSSLPDTDVDYDTSKEKSHAWSLYTLMLLMGFQALSGLAGGFGLISDPTGTALGIPHNWLAGSPFGDYLIPGIILFAVLGIFPAIVFVGLLRQSSWAYWASLAVGAGLVIWIAVEIMVIGYHTDPPLQAIYGTVGVLMSALTLNPRLREYLDL